MQEKQLKVLDEFTKLLNSGSSFSKFTLNSACASLEITQGELDLLFPYGMFEVAEKLWQKHISEVEASKEFGVTNGVKMAILSSFNLLTPYKRAVRKVVKFLLLPQNLPFAPKFFWKMADAIWKKLQINDVSFSFYTKRALLSGIYANCFAYFLLSKNHSNLEEVVEKQLKFFRK
jgi:ubiquinone biosynthesis protein COQ9